jgi:hypothetical protein
MRTPVDSAGLPASVRVLKINDANTEQARA